MKNPFGTTNFSKRLRHAALRVSSFARRPQENNQSESTFSNNLEDDEEDSLKNELSAEIYLNSINTRDSAKQNFETNKASSTQVIISLQNKNSSPKNIKY